MNLNIDISVIIPLYNKEKSIALTIESVLKQTFQNYEIIVINDGSTDSCLDVVKRFNDDKLNVYTTENKGVSYARNFGVSKAKYPYIAFLDADDYWYPFHLENLVNSINQYPISEWFATAYEIYHNARLCLPIDVPLMKDGEQWKGEVEDYFANSFRDGIAWTSAICMRKTFFEQLGGFDESLRNTQDTDLWVRAALQANLVFSNRVSARYIMDGDNHISQKNIDKKTIMDFDKYERENPHNQSLKQYLDVNRYAVALRYKMSGYSEMFLNYFGKIDINNLTGKQRFLLKCPAFMLRLLMSLQSNLEKRRLRLRTH